MRLQDPFLNTVAFLCIDEEGDAGIKERVPKASAFFLMLDGPDGVRCRYLVTARHCLEEVGNEEFYVRFNSGDRYVDEPASESCVQWFHHDSADVSLTLFTTEHPLSESGINPDVFVDADYTVDIAALSGPFFQNVEHDQQTGWRPGGARAPVGVGQEVAFVGLFVQSPGEKLNLPVARFGHVSRMPDEPVVFDRADGSRVELLVYLAECHSWGGHSGSPVFVGFPIIDIIVADVPRTDVTPVGKAIVQAPDMYAVALLGLDSGHFDIEQESETTGDILGSVTARLNAGMALVTPAEAIRELLERDDVADDREKRKGRVGDRRKATFDALPRKKGQSEFDAFDDLSRRLVNVPKDEIDEQRKKA